MILNFFKVAWRNMASNKFYTFINVAGLSMGLVIGLLILLWVQDELSFDKFNKNADNIYKIGIVGSTGPTNQIFSNIIAPVATFAKNELPEVKDAFRINNIGEAPAKYQNHDKAFLEHNIAFTDASYFSMLDFHLIRGNQNKPFYDNNSMVISQSIAKKYFGNEDPMGKVITIDNKFQFRVTGIINDPPENSSFKQTILLPLGYYNNVAYVEHSTSYNGTSRIASMDADWINFSYETYLLVKPNTNAHQLEKKLQHIHERQKPDDAPVPYLAQPILKMHLYRADGSNGGIETVQTFSIVALLILVIASINYVNLSTARAMLRAKEVSMRKIIGAGRLQLFIQFVVETTLLFVIAAALAICLLHVLLPTFNQFAGKHLTLSPGNYRIWLCIVIALLGTLVTSSVYPAMLLSSFDPLKALKGKITAGVSNNGFRRALVIVQFSISIMLIIGTLIIGNQLSFIRNKNLGYDKQNVLSFQLSREMTAHYDAIKAELLKQPGILSVTRSGTNIIDYEGWTGDNDWHGKPLKSNLLFHPIGVDKDFLSFFKMKLATGSNFTGAVADSAHYIVNETAVTAMGIQNPVGKSLRIQKTKGTIIGVVKDFNFTTMRKKIEPAVFVYSPANSQRVYIKTTGRDAAKAVSATQNTWKHYNNKLPLDYSFLDESFNKLYNTEQRTASLFNLFSIVTIVLSCLGLFGLATYTAQVRTREIGIRKVFGASVGRIITLMATEFMLLVIISLFIAVPVAWYAMNKWLLDFAYRTNIQVWTFALAGGSAIVIAFITISFQSVKAALMNPVKSLRNE